MDWESPQIVLGLRLKESTTPKLQNVRQIHLCALAINQFRIFESRNSSYPSTTLIARRNNEKSEEKNNRNIRYIV